MRSGYLQGHPQWYATSFTFHVKPSTFPAGPFIMGPFALYEPYLMVEKREATNWMHISLFQQILQGQQAVHMVCGGLWAKSSVVTSGCSVTQWRTEEKKKGMEWLCNLSSFIHTWIERDGKVWKGSCVVLQHTPSMRLHWNQSQSITEFSEFLGI